MPHRLTFGILSLLFTVFMVLPVEAKQTKEFVRNKLVRDKILDSLIEDNIPYEARILTDEEYRLALSNKLQEEVFEFLTAKSDMDALKELADVEEVIHAIIHEKGISYEDLEKIRKEKLEKKGGFSQRIFLEKETMVVD